MTNRHLIKHLFFILIIILLSACEHQVTLTPTITPSAYIAKKYPYRVAVVFTPEIQDLVVSAKPSKPFGPGFVHIYHYPMGDSLSQALLRSADTAYNEVVVADLDLKEGEVDRVIKFTLINSSLTVEFAGAFFPTAKGNYTLSVLMEAFDGQNLNLIQKAAITGNGSVSQQADGRAAAKLFSTTIEQAIQQVSDNAANLLTSGFGEIK